MYRPKQLDEDVSPLHELFTDGSAQRKGTSLVIFRTSIDCLGSIFPLAQGLGNK